MLKEKTLFEQIDKVKTAIARLKEFEPPEGYYLAFSGGKDSITIERLADMSGVKYDAHYSVTTIDPPELVHFIKREYPDVEWDRPPKAFLTRMVSRGFPLRQSRWCCAEYKEGGGVGRFVITGVRAAESTRRAGRKMIDICYKSGVAKRYLNVIVDWLEDDVWTFIREQKLPYCSLYDKGWKRIGCLFCPMASTHQRKAEVEMYPGYAKQFRKSFRKLYARYERERPQTAARWDSGDHLFEWWLSGKSCSKNPDQKVLFE